MTRKGFVTRAEDSIETISRQLSATQEAISRMRAYETVDLTMRNGRSRSVSHESLRALVSSEHATLTMAVRAAESLNEMTALLASTLREALPETEPATPATPATLANPQKSPLRRENSAAPTLRVKVATPPRTSSACCFCPGRVPEQVVDAVAPTASSGNPALRA